MRPPAPPPRLSGAFAGEFGGGMGDMFLVGDESVRELRRRRIASRSPLRYRTCYCVALLENHPRFLCSYLLQFLEYRRTIMLPVRIIQKPVFRRHIVAPFGKRFLQPTNSMHASFTERDNQNQSQELPITASCSSCGYRRPHCAILLLCSHRPALPPALLLPPKA